jgi:hypothetical protein
VPSPLKAEEKGLAPHESEIRVDRWYSSGGHLARCAGIAGRDQRPQNVTFTVAKAVAITSTGAATISTAIDPSGGTPTGTTTSGLTVSSNDTAGFQITAKTNAATVTEAGTCTPAQSANVNIMSVSASTPTGQGAGSSAGTAASAFALSTTATNLYSAAPNYTGGTMSVTTNYTVAPGYTTPPNTSGCTYTVPVVMAITAL